MGLLLGQVSKWRAQRADGGAHAARGFVGGAAGKRYEAPGFNNMFQCRTRLCGWCSERKSNRGLCVRCGFNAARGFVGGAAVEHTSRETLRSMFQCRTRLCGWCSKEISVEWTGSWPFQCRTRLCGWCSFLFFFIQEEGEGFNAARGFVGGAAIPASIFEGGYYRVSMPHAAILKW